MLGENGLGFKEVLTKLKNDIKSIQEQDEKDRMFILEDIEIELSVTMTKGGDGGINIWVVKIGGSVEKENVHKVTLKLTPFTNDKQQSNKGKDDKLDDSKKGSTGGGSAFHPKYNRMILDKLQD